MDNTKRNIPEYYKNSYNPPPKEKDIKNNFNYNEQKPFKIIKEKNEEKSWVNTELFPNPVEEQEGEDE